MRPLLSQEVSCYQYCVAAMPSLCLSVRHQILLPAVPTAMAAFWGPERRENEASAGPQVSSMDGGGR